MPTITGGFKIERGKELPQNVKDALPFKAVEAKKEVVVEKIIAKPEKKVSGKKK